MRGRTQATVLFQLFVAMASLQSQLAAAATCSSKAPGDVLIVLDVGHVAPTDGCKICATGQISARGVPEYAFNLKLAQRTMDELVQSGFRSTSLMVTHLTGGKGLKQRAERANNMRADIFVSLHHDGVRDRYLRPWMYQGQKHFFFDEAQGFSLHVSPWNARYGESLALARLLADELIANGLHFNTVHQPSNPVGARVPFIDSTRGIYRRDRLVVLKRTEMPAILLEAGVIVNRDEALLVSSPAYKTTIATSVVKAITQFCSNR